MRCRKYFKSLNTWKMSMYSNLKAKFSKREYPGC
jgi:hypothetical protein